ncbi:MAG: toll/interleukin-1 receptor domain-containing protein [Gemmatimonadaceae bacterium]
MAGARVFLSYASEDQVYARCLRDAMEAAGLTTYFDAASLRAGAKWETALDDALDDAEHLVCLWSSHAHASPWVGREVMTFWAQKVRAGKGKAILVRLDDRESAFGSLQQIDDAPLKAAYAAGAPAPTACAEIATRLHVALSGDRNIVQYPVALFALTTADIAHLSPADLEAIRKRLGLEPAALTARYGPTRLDWKPFRSDVTIRQSLDRALMSINQRVRDYSVAWEYPPADFWQDTESGAVNQEAVRQFAARLINARAGIVLVDPVAVKHSLVQDRLGLFQRCARAENVAVIALSPNDATQEDVRFDEWLGQYANAVLDRTWNRTRSKCHRASASGCQGANSTALSARASLVRWVCPPERESLTLRQVLGRDCHVLLVQGGVGRSMAMANIGRWLQLKGLCGDGGLGLGGSWAGDVNLCGRRRPAARLAAADWSRRLAVAVQA